MLDLELDMNEHASTQISNANQPNRIDKCLSGPHSSQHICANHVEFFMLNLIYITDPVSGKFPILLEMQFGKISMALRNNPDAGIHLNMLSSAAFQIGDIKLNISWNYEMVLRLCRKWFIRFVCIAKFVLNWSVFIFFLQRIQRISISLYSAIVAIISINKSEKNVFSRSIFSYSKPIRLASGTT